MRDKLFFYIFSLIPKNHLSYIVGKIANINKPKILVHFIIKKFVSFYKINTQEIEKDILSYTSLAEFFNRYLKDGARVPKGDFISPCDGFLRNTENLDNFSLEVIKGKRYNLEEILASKEDALKVENGFFINIYLSPKDYHNVHSPVEGVIKNIRYIPGKLWPVTSLSLNTVENLFSINERLVFEIESNFGNMFLIMVGATNVGKMTSPFIDFATNNLKDRIIKDFLINKKVSLMQEIGSFRLGSTVVMILDKNFKDKINFVNNKPVKLGDGL